MRYNKGKLQQHKQGEIIMYIKLGENIRSLRKSRNISQEVLAQYLGVSFQAVSKWETGVSQT